MEFFKEGDSYDFSRCTIGFLGCGKISSAVAKGFASAHESRLPLKIIVSPRSADKANELRNAFPGLVQIASSNEQVVEQSNIIFIGLLPSVAREILPTMPFNTTHLVISMMAAVNYREVVDLCRTSIDCTVKCVPLPSAASRSGPIIYHPLNKPISLILGMIGTAIPCGLESEMKPLITLTGHISTFYELMNTSLKWMVENNIPEENARLYISSFYSTLATSAQNSHHSFAEMVEEASTPGGLNEQSVQYLREQGHFESHKQSMQAILDRLKR